MRGFLKDTDIFKKESLFNQTIFNRINRYKSIDLNLEKCIALLEDIFALVNQNELYMDEQKYLRRS